MDDLGFGRLIRMARIRRAWRQEDVADRARVTRTVVSRVERGHLGELPLDDVRAVAAVLDIRVEVQPRARAIDLDRVLNWRHSALAEYVIAWLTGLGGWVIRPEVSFSEFGERGVIDLLCWHPAARALLVVEIKTELVEFGEMLATLHTKHRLAREIARRLGWNARIVSSGLLIADSTTNRRRAADHRALLQAALPDDGRALVRWLKDPVGEVRALRFVPDARSGHVRSGFAGATRVRLPKPRLAGAAPRSARPSASPAQVRNRSEDASPET